jgi:hypothetical protein
MVGGDPPTTNKNKYQIPNTMQTKLQIGLLAAVSFKTFAPTTQNKAAVRLYANATQTDAKMTKASTDLIDKSWLGEIKSAQNAARAISNEMTLPWQDRGLRLLPAKNVVKFQDEMAKARRKWETAVDEFVVKYDEILEDSRRKLNGTFNQNRYPSSEAIRHRFQMMCEFMPLPDNDRLRVELQDEMEDLFADRLRDAGRTLRLRLVEKLQHLADKCASVGGESAGKFYSSNVTNVLDLCDAIPDMLVGDDPDLMKAVSEARDMLAHQDADSIKSSASIAQDVRAKADAIANSLL